LCSQKTQEQQRVLHAAMLEEAQRLGTHHQSTITTTLLKMFGSLSLNGFVFLSIFTGVSSLTMHKVWGLCGLRYWVSLVTEKGVQLPGHSSKQQHLVPDLIGDVPRVKSNHH